MFSRVTQSWAGNVPSRRGARSRSRGLPASGATVFISYSSRNRAVAQAVCAALEAGGLRCWMAPRDLDAGAVWGEAIIEAIAACRVLVLVFSSHANRSAQVLREVGFAVSEGKPVLPLRIEDVQPTGAMLYYLGTVHWLDAIPGPSESHLARLAGTVANALPAPEDAPPFAPEQTAPSEGALADHPTGRPVRLAVLVLALVVLAVLAFLATRRQDAAGKGGRRVAPDGRPPSRIDWPRDSAQVQPPFVARGHLARGQPAWLAIQINGLFHPVKRLPEGRWEVPVNHWDGPFGLAIIAVDGPADEAFDRSRSGPSPGLALGKVAGARALDKVVGLRIGAAE